jgi:DNA-binding CsgD family transcriptional regulator
MIEDGYPLKEIATIYKVSESRISQIVTMIKSRLYLKNKIEEISSLKKYIRDVEITWLTL